MVVDPTRHNRHHDDPLLVSVAPWVALLASGHAKRPHAFFEVTRTLSGYLYVLQTFICLLVKCAAFGYRQVIY